MEPAMPTSGRKTLPTERAVLRKALSLEWVWLYLGSDRRHW